jgi:hypothetical protein
MEPATEFTPRQRAALSFAALVRASAPWRDQINVPRLSFTEQGWDPGSQLYGSVAACLAQLHLGPGCAAALGFAALDDEDAAELLGEWERLLATPRRPSLRKGTPQ